MNPLNAISSSRLTDPTRYRQPERAQAGQAGNPPRAARFEQPSAGAGKVTSEMRTFFPGLFGGQNAPGRADADSKPDGRGAANAGLNGKPVANAREHERLRKAAGDFQAIFIGQMLKAMRANLHPENGMLYGGNRQKIFEDMLYDEYAKNLSASSDFNLADQIYKQLSPALGPEGGSRPAAHLNRTASPGAAPGQTADSAADPAEARSPHPDQVRQMQRLHQELRMSRSRISTDQLRLDSDWIP
ncbi:MAG: rod-binding protein [Leptospiraceae bacterium]|nr:rod-binding protein [Leptospiraceae bacterium]